MCSIQTRIPWSWIKGDGELASAMSSATAPAAEAATARRWNAIRRLFCATCVRARYRWSGPRDIYRVGIDRPHDDRTPRKPPAARPWLTQR